MDAARDTYSRRHRQHCLVADKPPRCGKKDHRQLGALQTIADNLEDLVYVNSLETYELMFVSKSLGKAHNTEPENLIGQSCWKVLQIGQTGPCSFCPIPHLFENGKPLTDKSYTWEYKNLKNGRWHLVRDSLITWVDGKLAHLERLSTSPIKSNMKNSSRFQLRPTP